MHVIICCSSGMSSSLLARKLEKVVEAKGLNLKVSTMDIDLVRRNFKEADLILLGPHIKYKLEEVRSMCGGWPRAELIDTKIYQTFNGEMLAAQILSYELVKEENVKPPIETWEKGEELWTNLLPFKSFFTPETLEAMQWRHYHSQGKKTSKKPRKD